MLRKLKEKYHTIRQIREAINTYPDGICFAAVGGRPILANYAINHVCCQLTGHTITNADVMWDELNSLKIETSVFSESDVPPVDVEQILCRLPNEGVWQFQRRTLRLDDSNNLDSQMRQSILEDKFNEFRAKFFEYE